MYGTINQNQSCEPHFLDYSSFSLIFEYAKSMNNYAWHFPILKFHEYSQSSFISLKYSIPLQSAVIKLIVTPILMKDGVWNE